MTATTTTRTPSPAGNLLADGTGLTFEREDITFTSPEPGLLAVELTITNAGPHPTGSTFGLLQSAPLGAFVPWTPLDAVLVPALRPGESAVITKEYAVERPEVLGSADRIPPDRLLVALGLGEPDRSRRRRAIAPAAPRVATDLLQLLALGGLHWAGNLNLFIGQHDVERHVAQELRIYPGRLNMADFVVGGGTAEEYRFAFSGDGTAWNPRLFEAFPTVSLAASVKSDALTEGTWYRARTRVFWLAVEPPADAVTGAVNVHVCQKSSGREAVVEFTMDARAAGPGCYKV
jgi:hypothetical protein